MTAQTVATLTLNPAIDFSFEVDRVFHTHKNRARNERYFPGGGGINVARILKRLGDKARCHYLVGGVTGATFDALLDRHGLERAPIAISGTTRIATAAYETETEKEFRFTPEGPDVSEWEWQACLDHLDQTECDWLVCSGSLPRGVPLDFYGRVAERMTRRGTKVVLDTSGDALREGLASGHVYLAKPSLSEFRTLTERELQEPDEILAAAQSLVHSGTARHLAVTLGERGALLAGPDEAFHLPAIKIEAKSAVGAGDSFVAGMVHALTHGHGMAQAFRLGMAAGAAAAMTAGSDLARKEDIDRLLPLIPAL